MMTLRQGALGLAFVMLGFLHDGAWANGEKVVVGEVETVSAQRNVLVVSDIRTEKKVRLTVDSGTEVERCRKSLSLSDVRAGATVRVKYLEKAAGGLEALSILILPAGPKPKPPKR